MSIIEMINSMFWRRMDTGSPWKPEQKPSDDGSPETKIAIDGCEDFVALTSNLTKAAIAGSPFRKLLVVDAESNKPLASLSAAELLFIANALLGVDEEKLSEFAITVNFVKSQAD